MSLTSAPGYHNLRPCVLSRCEMSAYAMKLRSFPILHSLVFSPPSVTERYRCLKLLQHVGRQKNSLKLPKQAKYFSKKHRAKIR